jgi:hypothetical protein
MGTSAHLVGVCLRALLAGQEDFLPENTSDAELAKAASDPSTPQAMLADLAYDHPELRVAIALNPATYDGLLEWLGELDDPDVQSALAQRGMQPTMAKSSITETLGEVSVPVVGVRSSVHSCRSCGSLLRSSANYCGNCGTFVTGRTPFSTVGNLTPAANRAIFASSIAALVVVVLVATGVTTVGTVLTIQNAAAASAATSDDSGSTDGAQQPSAQPHTRPTAQPTATLPPLGVGFTADDPSLYGGLSAYGDDIDLRSPSGNIHCGIDLPSNSMGQAAGCYLDHYTYTPPQPNPCATPDGGSDAAYGGLWSLEANGVASAVCYQGMQFGGGDNTARMLPYGHSLTFGGYIFISESTGMSIVKISTRHGVKLNLSSWTEL